MRDATFAYTADWNTYLSANSDGAVDYAHETALDPAFGASGYALVNGTTYASQARAWAEGYESAYEARATAYLIGRGTALDPYLHGTLDQTRADALSLGLWPACFVLVGGCPVPTPHVPTAFDTGVVPIPPTDPGSPGCPDDPDVHPAWGLPDVDPTPPTGFQPPPPPQQPFA
jgi:hypothetical protein